MSSLTFPKPDPLIGDGLVEELQKAGLPATHILAYEDRIEVFGVDDADRRRVGAVVSAHTGRGPDAYEEEKAADADRTDKQEKLAALEAKAKAVWAGDDTFTMAQAQKIMAGLVLVELRRRGG